MINIPEILSQTMYFLTPIALVSLIFIFLIFRPQHKKITAHKNFIKNLQSGDEVITYGGIIGIIDKIEDDIVCIKIDQNTTIKIIKSNILEKYSK
jgi:preprotein translocase subunit YajC